MAVLRDRPYSNSNFLVDLGDGDVHSVAAGFSEVVFPTFAVDAGEADEHTAAHRLILKRGAIGALNLYAWWHKARRGKAPQRRTVKVELLGDDRATVVLTWRFRNARPVSLTYSPLHASEGGLLIETLELAFDSVEMR